jgi:hypothetical protein
MCFQQFFYYLTRENLQYFLVSRLDTAFLVCLSPMTRKDSPEQNLAAAAYVYCRVHFIYTTL